MAYVGASEPPSGCVFCVALAGSDDRKYLVLHRGERSFLILNAFPYTSGHLMAVVNRHVATLADATPEELADLMALVQRGVRTLTAEYQPQGFNIGINQGRVAGAGIQDHLHVHVVPRWGGDVNFMSVTGDVRVLPEALGVTWERVRSRIGG